MIRAEPKPIEPTPPMAAELVQPFDYSVLAPDQATKAREAATFISERRQATTRAILDIGAKLIEVKASLGHGHFLSWLDAECGWSERAAQNYMQAAKSLGTKSATVADLPVTTVYELAKAPEPVRERVLERMETGRLPVEKVRILLSEEKDAERRAEADARKTPEQRKRDKERAAWEKAEHQKRMAKIEEAQARREAAGNRVAVMIMEKFGDDLPTLLSAIDEADIYDLRRWLRLNGSDRLPDTVLDS